MRTLRFFCSALITLAVVGCGTTPMKYEPKEMTLKESFSFIDQMVMTQHPNWKPDYFMINEDYIGWNYGQVSSATGSAVGYGGVAWGTSTAVVREASERVYFSKISSVQLNDWQRKFQQWYAVALMGDEGQVLKYILRTRDKDDAMKMVDALSTVINERHEAAKTNIN